MSSIQIPNLPAAIALGGTELLEIVQAGVSVYTTTAAISSLALRSANTWSAPQIMSANLTLMGGASLLATTAPLTNGSGASSGTLTNAPSAGNPTKWIAINDGGVIRHFPAW